MLFDETRLEIGCLCKAKIKKHSPDLTLVKKLIKNTTKNVTNLERKPWNSY